MNINIVIKSDSPQQMKQNGWRLAGKTDDTSMLSKIRRDYLAAGYTDVVFSKSEKSNLLYWVK